MNQPVKEKENSEFKLAEIHLEIDCVTSCLWQRGWVNTYMSKVCHEIQWNEKEDSLENHIAMLH